MDDRQKICLKPELEDKFREGWEQYRILLFSAPCGCGKTTSALALLQNRKCCTLSAEESAFTREELLPDCEVVLVDDLQYLQDQERQKSFSDLIRSRADLHFILLGRCRMPGWLMPFQLSGLLQVIETEDLMFDKEVSRHFLELHNIRLSGTEMSEVYRDFKGYPIALKLLCRLLSGQGHYSAGMADQIRHELFVYYDDAVFHRFEPDLRTLLLCLAPFGSFQIELARLISGDPKAGELLGILQRDTQMLQSRDLETYYFWPVFSSYLMWKFRQEMSEADQEAIYERAALYYELRGDLSSALTYYKKSGDQKRISVLLVKNAQQHPGVGHYRELQDYYFELPKEEIQKSPVLMCGMSMMTALCYDYETSEYWYQELKKYAAHLKSDDSEWQEVRGRLAYLEIALPQRGTHNLTEVMRSLFQALKNKRINMPEFSVTSTLPSIMNGGKDFCNWSRKDDILYVTMRAPVEALLGRDGIGLADCAICESKFEKGDNVSEQMLTLMARLGDIQARGTADIEFAVMGLLARIQVSQGKASTAIETIENLREKYVRSGEDRFLGNLDALLVRIRLRLGDDEAVRNWLDTAAPKNDVRLWAMWRYQYLTRVMAELSAGRTEEPLQMLARLRPYFEDCGRVMDSLHISILTALCRKRQQDEKWREYFCNALDVSRDYRFVWPIAQYGAAVLPLLQTCNWNKDKGFLNKLMAAARKQAVFYPRFLQPFTVDVEPLSAAEEQVLRLLCQNLSNAAIGEILDIKVATVKTHVSHILQKLDVKNRSEAREAAEKLHLL